jgi:hypothetical protein
MHITINVMFHWSTHLRNAFIFLEFVYSWWIQASRAFLFCTWTISYTDLVQCSSALCITTQAWNLLILDREFVVICYFFINTYLLFGVNNYFLLTFNCDNFGITIGLKNEKKDLNAYIAYVRYDCRLKPVTVFLWFVSTGLKICKMLQILLQLMTKLFLIGFYTLWIKLQTF